MLLVKQIISAIVLVICAGSAFGQNANLVEVTDNVYSYFGPTSYISMFVVTDEGVIAIEPVSKDHSKGLVAAIKSVTDKPIRYLLISHNHWDHAKGGQIFKDEDATIITHVEAAKWMDANPHPDLVPPDESWDGARKNIELGGVTLELHHFGNSHGKGMTVFLLPKEKFAYVADLVAPNRLPFMFLPDFSVGGLENTLAQIEQMDFDKAIFSHNEMPNPRAGGSKQDVSDTLQYLGDLKAAMQSELAKGANPRAIPGNVRLPKYEHWVMYDQWLSLNAWRIFLDWHMGPFPSHPD